VILLLLTTTCVLRAATISNATHYQTDFAGSVSNDFCDGSIMEWPYNSHPDGWPYTPHSGHEFADGSLSLYADYGGDAFQALIAGGEQSPTLVPVGHDGDLIRDYAYGLFSNTVVEMTYTLYNPIPASNHTDVCAYIAARKNDSPANTNDVGPFWYRSPHYLAWYDGVRLSVGEWSFKYLAPPREIVGVDVTAGSGSSAFKLVLSVDGGDDNGGVLAGATPCEVAAEIWENGTQLARAAGEDDPYDWSNGPEVTGTTFDAGGDYGYGAWNPYAGDWDDAQSWSRGNHDIRLTGWIVIGMKNTISDAPFRGIVVTALSVRPPGPLSTVFRFR